MNLILNQDTESPNKIFPTLNTLGPIMLDIEGLTLSKEDKALIQHELIGGIIFFSRNYESQEQLKLLVDSIRAIKPEIVLAVDQEGGRVQRLRTGFTRIPSMQTFLPLYESDSDAALEFVKDVGWLMAVEVLACGIDISFAPVLDVDDCRCSVISDRSFSADAQQVATLARAFIDGMHEAGMAVTGKHFPGHGGVAGDSHLELPIDPRSWSEIESSDLIPFATLNHQLDAIMPAHIVFPSVDKSPVGFSKKWLQETLRENMGYDGVIFSDDLTMEGASIAGSYGDRAEAALAAGCDVALVCNNRNGVLDVVKRLESLNVKKSQRFSRMTAKQSWDWSELKSTQRWQATQQKLQALLVV